MINKPIDTSTHSIPLSTQTPFPRLQSTPPHNLLSEPKLTLKTQPIHAIPMDKLDSPIISILGAMIAGSSLFISTWPIRDMLRLRAELFRVKRKKKLLTVNRLVCRVKQLEAIFAPASKIGDS
ncbi:hypothetical protein K432DRAFT_39461 [Lepidopterella palustris CBS 459.81]|uniref:Uncharacterized protein n=1 Tax=Lepidopterella palustris CBS 459.81 TaxID=1314670 RepID=A0A8E2EB36_9PEZI|nr:hypothetical protein K432DRAFT_39461 [Lepidopterella palustris CBS 459.81]